MTAPYGEDLPEPPRSMRSSPLRRREKAPVADQLIVRGAREHNLRDVSLDLPRDALIVFTAGLFIIRSLEMYLRAKRVMAAAE